MTKESKESQENQITNNVKNMTTTYVIDRIRQIAIWDTGTWYNCVAGPSYSFKEVDSVQACRRDVSLGGFRYPVVVIGNEWSPIVLGKYIESGYVDEVIIPDSVKRIGSKAFSDAIFEDAKIDLPYSLLEIGSKAFWESQMKKIVIPQNVISIGSDAFPPDMEVECLSPHLVREEDNCFMSKRYQPEGSFLECRITDPIKKEVSACRFVGKDGENFVFPDSVNIEGKDYLVTGIDCEFGFDLYGDITLPSHLRKIGHNYDTNYGSFTLPDTIKYIGKNSISTDIILHLPKELRIIGEGSITSEVINHSPYIDIDRCLVMDLKGTPLYHFGNSKILEMDSLIKKFRLERNEMEDDKDIFCVEEYDYNEYFNYSWFEDSLDSSTF